MLIQPYHQLCNQLAVITFDNIVIAYKSNNQIHQNCWKANQVLLLTVADELQTLIEATGGSYIQYAGKKRSENKVKTKGLDDDQLDTVIDLINEFSKALDDFRKDCIGQGRLILALQRVDLLTQNVKRQLIALTTY